jgi:hypothetical protein
MLEYDTTPIWKKQQLFHKNFGGITIFRDLQELPARRRAKAENVRELRICTSPIINEKAA